MTSPSSGPYVGRHSRHDPEPEPYTPAEPYAPSAPYAPPYAAPNPYPGAQPYSPQPQPYAALFPPEPDFLPLVPQRRSRGRLTVAVLTVAAVAVIGAVAWFVMTLTHSKRHPTTTPAAVQTDLPVVVHSAQGQFDAHFAHQPTVGQLSSTFGGVSIQAYVYGDPAAHLAIEAVALTPGLPDSEVDAFVQGVSNGMNRGNTEVTMQPTTFLGHRAFESDTTTPTGDHLHELLIMYSSSRAYLLIAPAGAQFAVFENAFSPVP